MSNHQNQAALDALLDNTISDLADLPEFKPFPAGAHRCVFNYGTKMIGENPSLLIKLKAVETVELSDPDNDQPLEAGTEIEVPYNLANEFGQGMIKKLAAKFLAAQGMEDGNFRQAFDPFVGNELIFVTTLRTDKKDAEKKYTGIAEVIFEMPVASQDNTTQAQATGGFSVPK